MYIFSVPSPTGATSGRPVLISFMPRDAEPSQMARPHADNAWCATLYGTHYGAHFGTHCRAHYEGTKIKYIYEWKIYKYKNKYRSLGIEINIMYIYIYIYILRPVVNGRPRAAVPSSYLSCHGMRSPARRRVRMPTARGAQLFMGLIMAFISVLIPELITKAPRLSTYMNE